MRYKNLFSPHRWQTRLLIWGSAAAVGLAAVAAREMPKRMTARDRINTNAVWITVTFVLNVLAFLLMGLQARGILSQLQGSELTHALAFAGLVLAAVILVRFAWVMSYGAIIRRFLPPNRPAPSARVGILVSWCGMRGLVTLATAFALPPEFPKRDVIVLSAFTVVLGSLILQGFTIRPLIFWLKIARDETLDDEVAAARDAMLAAALAALDGAHGTVVEEVRAELSAQRSASAGRERPNTESDELRRRALGAERALLEDWREDGRVTDDVYHHLEEELDRAELAVEPPGASWPEA